MKNSITTKVFLIIFISIFAMLFMMGTVIKVALPDYYRNKMVKEITTYRPYFEKAIEDGDTEKLQSMIVKIKDDLNGNITIQDFEGNTLYVQKGQGQGFGKNQQKIEIPQDALNEFEYEYANPNHIEFYIYGMRLEKVWVIYQIQMETIFKVTNTVTDFFMVIVWISLGLAILLSLVISRLITKPIIQLNNLTEEMKSLKMEPLESVDRKDEIGLLTNSVILLYKDLVGNISKLEKALQKEKSLDQLRKQFVYRVSHELQTPFAVIKAYAEALRDGMYKDEAEKTEYLNIVYDESENMSKLIHDILDLSKLESGEFQISKERFDVKNWMDTITGKFKKIIEKKDLVFKIERYFEDLSVLADPFRLEQAVKNLLMNAIEHSSGEVSLSIKESEDSLEISVYNSGEHIHSDDIHNVFESFYKKKGKKTGVGLGLSIVKNIVELHDGFCEVKNVLGGVLFLIRIPNVMKES